jgi:hypothetical protein
MGQLFTLLLAMLFGVMPFIAMMCIWSNTGKMAHFAELQWRLMCRDRGFKPKEIEKSLME